MKMNNIDTVAEFRRKYLKKNDSDIRDDQKNKYYTKYNSNIDYIEKDTFLKEDFNSKSGINQNQK